MGLITKHLLPIAAAQGRFPLAASCQGANFIYAGCVSVAIGRAVGLGAARGDSAPRRGSRVQGDRLLFPLGLEAGSKPQKCLSWLGSVEGCQGLFSETPLMVTSQARGNASPVLLAHAEPSKAGGFCETTRCRSVMGSPSTRQAS